MARPRRYSPMRANIQFFIRLRKRVQHRYAKEQQALAVAATGQAQALLLNYEGTNRPARHGVCPSQPDRASPYS